MQPKVKLLWLKLRFAGLRFLRRELAQLSTAHNKQWQPLDGRMLRPQRKNGFPLHNSLWLETLLPGLLRRAR
ncbi:hypothetical protein D3C75_814790 [compost metagenome]